MIDAFVLTTVVTAQVDTDDLICTDPYLFLLTFTQTALWMCLYILISGSCLTRKLMIFTTVQLFLPSLSYATCNVLLPFYQSGNVDLSMIMSLLSIHYNVKGQTDPRSAL
jgi:hypothetical protein